MADKLTDTQRVILAAAAASDDGNVLPIPASVNVKGGALTAVLKSLLGRGFLVERAASNGEPAWRTDEVTGKFALVITPTGLQAIGVEPDTAPTAATQAEGAAKGPKSHRRAAGRRVATPAPKPPRETKQALVIAMLRRQDGASIEEIVDATGWAPHSVRGFMSGALKRRLGMNVISEKNASGARRYFVGPLRTSEV